jgi:hypothetical protein
MEDDLEEYWAAIRPAPKPSISSLRDELLKISKLREEEWDLMTHRNYPSGILGPPTSEVLHPTFYGDDSGSIRIDSSSLRPLQVEPTGVQIGPAPENIGNGLSGGGPLLVSSGGMGSWDSIHHLDISGNNDFNQLQSIVYENNVRLTYTLSELLGRIARLESDNQELRARMDLLEFNTRNR